MHIPMYYLPSQAGALPLLQKVLSDCIPVAPHPEKAAALATVTVGSSRLFLSCVTDRIVQLVLFESGLNHSTRCF